MLIEHNLVKLDFTWNLLNNLKSEENQKKVQLQKLFQITPSFSTNFLEILSPLSYFLPCGNHFEFILVWKFCHAGPTHQWSGG
jgi:hypothetical protein